METLVSLPVIVFLLSALGGCILWTVRTVLWQKADWELQEEVRYVMERIVEDASKTEYADIWWDGRTVYFQYWDMVKSWTMSRPPEAYAKYEWLGVPLEDFWWIAAERTGMPLTGKSVLGKVTITEFHCSMATDHLFHVRITGRSKVTGHEFSLESAVYMRGHP